MYSCHVFRIYLRAKVSLVHKSSQSSTEKTNEVDSASKFPYGFADGGVKMWGTVCDGSCVEREYA